MPRLTFFSKRTALTAVTALYFAASAAHAAPQIVGKVPARIPAQTLSQIDALERDADARSPIQQKISSQLLYSMKMARGEQIVPGIQTLRTTAKIDGQGMTLVDMETDVTPDVLYAITRAGGTVVNTSERFGAVRASVPLLSLETLASVPGVRFIRPAVYSYPQNPAPLKHSARTDFLSPFVLPVPQNFNLSQKAANLRVHLPSLLARAEASFPGPQTDVGSVVDEADKTHQADSARSTYSIDGTGIKVGVLSDSLDNGNGVYADAVNSGDVSTVTVISGQSGGNGSAEGLAMLEDVHHLAPGAQLYFATGDGGNAKFADNILALQKAGCKVIVDDLFSDDDSPFQDSVISQAINTVTAAGVMYFSCAANFGNIDNGTASVWEGDYNDSGDTSLGDGDIHTFDSSEGVNGEENAIQVNSQSGDTGVELFWSDPLGKSSNDYDLVILDSSFNVVASSTDRQTGSQDPYEEASAATGDYALIIKHSGSTRYLHMNLQTQNSIFNFVTNGRVSGHNATANAFCCAATPAAHAQTYSNTGGTIPGSPTGPYPDPFNSSNKVEIFSDDGGRRVFYNPDGSAITSGNFTHTGGKLLVKPDFTAADGTSNTLTSDEVGSGKEVLSPFFGTSCATPHAGAIAALVLSYNPSLTRAQLATILDNSATDIMASGIDHDSGYGILNALKAVQNTPAPTNSVKPKSIAFTPNPVVGGQNTTGTITLTGDAPSGGAVVTITEDGSSIGTVTVPAASTSVTFTLTPPTVTTAQTDTLGAVYNGTTVTTSLTVDPAPASVTLSSVVLTPTSVTAGQTSSGKITLSAVAPTGGATITLKSSDTSSATVPSSVTIAAGDKTISFTVTTKSVTSTKTVTITATVGSSSKTATLTITPVASAVTLSSLVLTPTSVTAGATSLGKITLSAVAPTGGATIALKSSDTSSATVPASVTIAAGDKSISFEVTTKSVTGVKSVTITATLGSSVKTATLTVNPATTVTVKSLSISPTSVAGGSSSTGTITLTGPAPSGGLAVTQTSSNTAAATLAGTLNIAAGATSANFKITTYAVSSTQSVTITSSANGTSKTATLTVTGTASTVTPSSVTFSPSSISSDGESTGTVTLSGSAPSGGAAVVISYSGSTILTATVPSGKTSTPFVLTFGVVSSTTTYAIDASYNGKTVSGSVTVKATSVKPVKLSLSPSTVSGGGSVTGTVTLSTTAPSGGADVEIYQGDADLGYVTVAGGQTSTTFTYVPASVTTSTTYTESAVYNGTTVTATLTVKP